MNRITFTIIAAFFVCISFKTSAQTEEFKTGKSLEIQYNILNALQRNYVDTIKFEKLLNIGIISMLQSLDPYTEYIPEEKEEDLEMLTTATYGGIGSLIKKIDSLGVLISQPYINSPSQRSGLQPGDIILKIDGEDTKPLTASQASNKMKGEAGSSVKFLVKKVRTGEIKEYDIKRERIRIPDVPYSGIINDSVGYIKMESFSVGGANEVKEALIALKSKGAKRIILDLRGNGGGIMDEAVKIVGLFTPSGTTVVTSKGRTAEFNNIYKTKEEPVDTLIPLTVMISSSSASASEIVAGAIQDLDRGLIVGTRSFGKGLIQGFAPVGYEGKLKYTCAKYYTPSGRCVQAVDYSNRNKDGSVGTIPDSLIKAFKTVKGRTVYDGGGITPDTIYSPAIYSRPVISLFYNDIIGDYALKYYSEHNSIDKPSVFKISDADYDDFIAFASKRNFDKRSGAEVLVDQMIKAAKDDKIYDLNRAEFDALEKKLNISKEETLRIMRNEIQPLIESAVCEKYYYTPGRVEKAIQTDEQLKRAVECK